MYMTFSDDTTLEVAPIADSWSLTGLTWNNRPTVDSPISSLGGHTKDYWDFNITAAAEECRQGRGTHLSIQQF